MHVQMSVQGGQRLVLCLLQLLSIFFFVFFFFFSASDYGQVLPHQELCVCVLDIESSSSCLCSKH